MRALQRPVRRAAATIFAVAAVLGTSVVVAGPAAAYTPPDQWCADNPGLTPCVESGVVTHNGTAHALSYADPKYGINFAECTGGCDGDIGWGVGQLTGNDDTPLLPSDTFTLTFDIGSVVPTDSFTTGTDVITVRDVANPPSHVHPAAGATHNMVTVSGHPTLTDDSSECTQNPDLSATCPQKSASSIMEFAGSIIDAGPDNTGDFADAMYGTDSWTNASNQGAPIFDGNPGDPDFKMLVPIGNPHEHADGSVAVGTYYAFVPNSLLRQFAIDDPSTITPASLTVTLESGDITVTPGDKGVTITITNIHWPAGAAGGASRGARSLKAKHGKQKPVTIKLGVITPTAPSTVHAKRRDSTHGKLTVKGAKLRGSKIVKYAARCEAKHEKTHQATSKSKHHLVVGGLTPGKGYKCQARAIAKAGPGKWSKPVTLSKH